MTQIINTNILSLNAQRNLSQTQTSLATSIQRLSSGLRINSAKDDAAGLAISERFTTQIRGLNVAVRNANDGISLSQTAEGAMASITNNLQRMRELAVQSANATNSASDRQALQAEVAQLTQEIDRVATQTQFNGLNLLDGTFQAQQFQVGANANQTITIAGIASARTSDLGQFTGFTIPSQGIGTPDNTPAAQSVTVGGAVIPLGTIANDARAIANAINTSGISGFSANANPTTVTGITATAGTAGPVNFSINNLTIPVNVTANPATNRANAVAAINAQSAVTGVLARDNGSGVDLVAADGRNISVAAGSSILANFGLAAADTGSTLSLRYEAPPGVSGSITWTGAFNPGSIPIAATGTAISAINIATVAGANTAISAIDSALTRINSSRADLGAIQNRFLTTIENLQITAENLTASRSRIMDADFAAETAALSRAQVLQQAGTAMVAQANQVPQGVLQLLQR